ncbi:MAG TPA: pseudoazurin [Paracoccaceae bacterium]|nr:pseudoazurin [Paracoccaceae bacterium]
MTRMIVAAAAAAILALPAVAEEHVVRMLNKGPDGDRMVFEPAVIHAETGDTVRFVPEDKGHNAVSEVVPEGAEEFRGRINEEIVYEVNADGVHLVKCTPHWALGMLALIVAGDDFSNLDDVQDVRKPGKADDRFEAYLEEARAQAEG